MLFTFSLLFYQVGKAICYSHFLCYFARLFNPFLTRFFAITSPIKTVFFDNSVTLKTVLICVYRTNWMCLTKTSVVQ